MRKALRFVFIVAALLFIHQSALAQIHFTAQLTTGQEVPAITTPSNGSGTGFFVLNASRTELKFEVTTCNLTGTISGAHFHAAPIGKAGGVVRSIIADSLRGKKSFSGVWRSTDSSPLSAALLDSLLNGKIYVNIHTAANGGGEIRGQVMLTGVGFTANLNAAQEVPPVSTPTKGTGTGAFILNPAKTELEFKVTVCDLTGRITGAHFHVAPAGKAGPVVRSIVADSLLGYKTFSGVWKSTDSSPLTAALVDSFLNGKIYVNIHTAANGGGEIRGQLVQTTGIQFSTLLTSGQEFPAVSTPTKAFGTGAFTLNPAMTELKFDVTVCDLTGRVANAHFHNGPAGRAAGVVRGIFADSLQGAKTFSGVWKSTDASPLSPTLVNELLNGRIYVNIHTAANGGGEVRGQLSGRGFVASLTSAQEIPTVAKSTTGTGTAFFTLNATMNELKFDLSVCDLNGPIQAAHFHTAPAGKAGGVVRDIKADFVGNTASGVWKSTDASSLTPALVDSLSKGSIYVNIHTADNPAGELRGQVIPVVLRAPVPIALARAIPNRTSGVTLEGVINTVDFQSPTSTNNEFYFQDFTGGMRLFIQNGKIMAPPGTLVRVKNGVIALDPNGRKNIETTRDSIQILGPRGLPPPKLVTNDFYKKNQAALEGQYIGIKNTNIVRGTWPAATRFETVITFDGTDSLAMFIDNDTDIDGSPQPTNPFDVLGVATHFRGVPQIQPSSRADFRPSGSLPVELVEFRANAIGTDVELNWRTASETDNYGFEIQRKQSNDEFQKIGFVPGHGTTQQAQSYRFVDSKLALGAYYYRLKQIDRDGSFSFSAVVEAVASIAPETFTLRQNHPNPFNPVTTIEFVLGQSQKARLAVYDVLGHEVALLFDGQIEAGKSYRLEFDGAKHASGIYFYRLQSGERTQIRKMLLSK